MKKVSVKSVGEVKKLLDDGYKLIYWLYWVGYPDTVSYNLYKVD